MLKPGGLLALAVWGREEGMPFFRVISTVTAGGCAGELGSRCCGSTGRRWPAGSWQVLGAVAPAGQTHCQTLPCATPCLPAPPACRPGAEYDPEAVPAAGGGLALRFGDPAAGLVPDLEAAGLRGVAVETLDLCIGLPADVWW